jgi:hypothetical protein
MVLSELAAAIVSRTVARVKLTQQRITAASGAARYVESRDEEMLVKSQLDRRDFAANWNEARVFRREPSGRHD